MFISLHLNSHVWSHSVLYQRIEFDCHRPWRAWLEKIFFQIRLAKKNNIVYILSLDIMLNVESFQLLLRMPLLLLHHPSVIHELKKKKSTLLLISAFVREALLRNLRGKTRITSRLNLNTFSSMIWSETETKSKFDQPPRSTDDRQWKSLTSSQRVEKKPLKWALVHSDGCQKRNERVLFSFFNQRNTFSTN